MTDAGLRTAPSDSPFQLLAGNGDSFSLTRSSPWNDTGRGGGAEPTWTIDLHKDTAGYFNSLSSQGGLPLEGESISIGFDVDAKKRIQEQKMDLLIQIGSQMGQEKPFGTQWRGALHADSPLQDFSYARKSDDSGLFGFVSSYLGWRDENLARREQEHEEKVRAIERRQPAGAGGMPEGTAGVVPSRSRQT